MTAAAFAAQVTADGVCYDPNHNPSKSAASVAADMEVIKSRGFDHVRTYISKFGSVNMGEVISNAGLRMSLGVPFPAGDSRDQADAAISAAQGGRVVYIFVGNENLASSGGVPGDMFELIAYIKSKVPGNVKVGTVQRSAEYLDRASSIGGFTDLVAACDVLGVNIHPFFNPNTNAQNGIKVLESQWNRVLNSGLPGIQTKLALTETGWPSEGSFGGNFGSVDGTNSFFNAYKSWAGGIADQNKYYFQMFDQPHRAGEGAFEATFGLLRDNGQDKVSGFDGPKPPAPAIPSTPAPTAAPTPTATPSTSTVNDTSSISASTSGSIDSESSSISSNESSSTSDSTASNEEKNIVEDNEKDTTDENSVKDSDPIKANTKSAGSSPGTVIGLVVAGGFFAIVTAFGFIYAARRKMQQKEESEQKDHELFGLHETPGHSLHSIALLE
jgi:glucan endo-1,3-beta-D-glucosidase